jgi:cell division protein FtsB
MKKKVNPIERKKLFRIVYWSFFSLIILSILFIGNNSFLRSYITRHKYVQLQHQVKKQQLVNDSLKAANRDLKTNPLAAEKIAREQLGYQKDDEKVFRFIPPAPQDTKKTNKSK